MSIEQELSRGQQDDDRPYYHKAEHSVRRDKPHNAKVSHTKTTSAHAQKRVRGQRAAAKMSQTYREGELVWAKMRGHPHWPAKVSRLSFFHLLYSS